MNYHTEYDEIDNILDEIFQESCDLDWQCNKPEKTNNNLKITVVKPEGEAEITYLKSLVSDISEKLMEIADKAQDLPDEQKNGSYEFTKERLISKLIELNNNIDCILSEIEPAITANSMNTSMHIIGGEIPMFNGMF